MVWPASLMSSSMRGWPPRQWSEWLGSRHLLLELLVLELVGPGRRLGGVHPRVLQQADAARLEGEVGGGPCRHLVWRRWGAVCLCRWSRLSRGWVAQLPPLLM